MNIKNKLIELINKPIKERKEWEHQVLIHMQFNGSVGDYLSPNNTFTETEIIEIIDKNKTYIKERDLEFISVKLLKKELNLKLK